MLRLVLVLLCGFLFGLGLAMSQMVNPLKVLGFLDVAGDWDPTLIFVMGSAVIVSTLGFFAVLKLEKPVAGKQFSLPTKTKIDKQLITGSAVFGVGWGLAGYCPGPVIASLSYGLVEPVIFVAAMLVGFKVSMLLCHTRQVVDDETAVTAFEQS